MVGQMWRLLWQEVTELAVVVDVDRWWVTVAPVTTDVSAADKQTVDAQAQRRRIKVWVYNSQNATPDVQRVNALAKSAGIPIATVTETLSPASASFEQWQVAELLRLERALHQATGR